MNKKSSREQRIVNQLKKQTRAPEIKTPIGTDLFLPNHSGDHSSGRVNKLPTEDHMITNKAYVDSVSSGAPEGTAVKSTGEAGGNKFLREDGDGTCSWQEVTADSIEGTNVLSTGEGGGNKYLREDGDGTCSWQTVTPSVALDDVSDVTMTSLGTDELLFTQNGSDWINQTLAEANIQELLAEGGFVDGDKTKLDGIESGADVTDATNVTAAGALMDSEVDADIKTLSLPANTTISAFGSTLIDDADQATAQTTLGISAMGVSGDLADASAGDSDDISEGSTNLYVTKANMESALDADNSSADTAYAPLVLYNTDATPPTASGFPVGTIYIQYTA